MSNPKRPLDYNYGLRGLPNGEAHETLNPATLLALAVLAGVIALAMGLG